MAAPRPYKHPTHTHNPLPSAPHFRDRPQGKKDARPGASAWPDLAAMESATPPGGEP